MRGFTFAQLAVIILIIIGLIGFVIIATKFLSDYASSTSSAGNSIANAGGGLSNCASYGGQCLQGCVGKSDLGEKLCTGGLTCCA